MVARTTPVAETPVAQAISARLSYMGMTQNKAATLAGLNRAYVRNILRGRIKEPGAVHLQALAMVLKCDPGDLLGGGDPSEPATLKEQAAPAAEAARLKAALRSIRARLQKLIDEIDELEVV